MRTRRLLAVLAALAAVVVLGAPAPAGAATSLEVVAGWGGRHHRGEPVPVRVAVTADRLLQGELEVSVDDQGTSSLPSVRLPVEVPGGSTKSYLVVVPTGTQLDVARIDVVLRSGDATVAEGSATVNEALTAELVGLLPGALGGGSLPGAAPLAVDAGTAHFNEVDPADLATPGALSSLDVLAAGPGELAELGAAGTATVLQWVAGGGHLLVDEARGEEVAGLPAAWQPGEDGRRRAGNGEVRSADGALAAGDVAGLIEPTPAARSGVSQFFGSGEPIDNALARDAGLRVPRIGWLVGFLAAYVLVAVPVTLTVLRRRGRGELGWVALPLVALGFTAGGWLAGRDLRDDATAAHATVVRVSDAGAVATTSVGVVSNGGGRVTTTFPATWQATGTGNEWFGPRTPVVATPTNDGVALTQRLQPGEFGVRTATGPVDLAGGVEVTATTDGAGRMAGTVRSTLPFDLEDVAVFQGSTGAGLGRLPAGGELAWDLEVTGAEDPWMSPARDVWRSASGWDGPPDLDSVVSFPLWEELEAHAPAGFRSVGSVLVAGWSRSYTPPVAGVADDLEGRTLVAATAQVTSPAGAPDLAVRTVKVRTGGAPFAWDGTPFVVRYTPPAGASGDLVVRAPLDGVTLEVWHDGAWQALGAGQAPAPGAGGDAGMGIMGPVADRALPAGSAQDGLVWVRLTVDDTMRVDPMMLAAMDAVTLRGAA